MHAALSTEDNGTRPGRYILLQEMEQRVFGQDVRSSLDKAFALKERLGRNRWQDVFSIVSAGTPSRWHSCMAFACSLCVYSQNCGIFVFC